MLQSKTYYSYDERGNLSGEQTRTYASEGLAGSTAEQAGLSNDANSVKTYHYDRFNRLVEYTDGDTVAEYEYNADNLRTAKTVNGRRTDYVWDGTNLRYETGGNGTHTYTYDPTGVHMMDGNYYVKDGHGNVTGMYDANAEFVSDTYYDAFGNITYGDAPNPFGYSGEYHDSETGLIYLRNRYYDSSTGRFITEDPAKDGVNWYSYCGGDPVNMVDPWGLDDYILYGEDQVDFAMQTKADLENDGHVVHAIYTDSSEDFYNGWADMGADGVSIDTVYIFVHGEEGALKMDNGDLVYADKLEQKEIDTIASMACDSGTLNSFESNVAVDLLYSQDVNQIIAPDGRNQRMSNEASKAFYSPVNNQPKREGRGYVLYQLLDDIVVTPYLSHNNEGLLYSTIVERGRNYAEANRSVSLNTDGKPVMMIYTDLLENGIYINN